MTLGGGFVKKLNLTLFLFNYRDQQKYIGELCKNLQYFRSSFFVTGTKPLPNESTPPIQMTEGRKADPTAVLSVIKLLSNNNGNYLGSTERALNKTLYRHFPETQLRVP